MTAHRGQGIALAGLAALVALFARPEPARPARGRISSGRLTPAASQLAEVEAKCPRGTGIVGGGFDTPPQGDVAPVSSYRVSERSWRLEVVSVGGGGQAATVLAY